MSRNDDGRDDSSGDRSKLEELRIYVTQIKDRLEQLQTLVDGFRQPHQRT